VMSQHDLLLCHTLSVKMWSFPIHPEYTNSGEATLWATKSIKAWTVPR